MKKHVIFALLVGVCSMASAQQGVDSLLQELKIAKNDSLKVDVLTELSYNLWQKEPEKAIDYGKQALVIAQEIKYQPGIALANKNIGLGYYVLGDYVDVIIFWEASLKAYRISGNKAGVANLLSNMGAVYYNDGDDANALDYFLQALKVAEEINDESRQGAVLTNIGNIYMDKPVTQDLAIDYFRRALRISRNNNDQGTIGSITNNLTEIFLEKEQYDSAMLYVDLSLASFQGTGYYATPLSVKGLIYKKLGEYQRAIDLQMEAVEVARSFDQKLELSQVLLRLGETYLSADNPNKALAAYNEALLTAKLVGSDYYEKDAYDGLARSHEKLGNFKEAYQNKDLFAEKKDDIFNQETEEKIRGLQFTYEIDKKQDEINLLEKTNQIQQLDNKRQEAISWGAGIIGLLIFFGLIGLYNRYRFINKTKSIIEKEKIRSDELLLNILPEETAEELKEYGEAKAKNYDSVSILFTDFKGFTRISTMMTPVELVKEIHECFKAFDIIMARNGVEKIKTIGDAYMAAGGLPKVNDTHAVDVARAALDINAYMNKLQAKRKEEGRPYFEIRIGIHTGPVVAGIVGIKKFAYDIWGDTVNVASRMESNSEAGKINISATTYEKIKDRFTCNYRGEIEAKNRGLLKMYFLEEEIGQEGDRIHSLEQYLEMTASELEKQEFV